MRTNDNEKHTTYGKFVKTTLEIRKEQSSNQTNLNHTIMVAL